MKPKWSDLWQRAAIAAGKHTWDSDVRMEILRDDARTTIHGTLYAVDVYVDGRQLAIIHDRSGRLDVYP